MLLQQRVSLGDQVREWFGVYIFKSSNKLSNGKKEDSFVWAIGTT